MGCIHSLAPRRIKDHQDDPEGTALKTDPEVLPEILQLAEVSTTCASTPEQQDSIKSTSLKKRSSMTRSKSEEQVMEQVMERHYDIDLTYITERIISVFFMPELEEQRYHAELQEMATMLKSKHQDKFLLLNLSEKRHDITRLIPKVQDFGWPDLHAPPLDRICTVCKAMETWLSADPNNVAVLHCKGNKGKTGVIVSAYMHYSKISAGAEQALTTLAMRRFCEDKVSSSLQPSQNRYIYYFGGLLSGAIKMNSSPLFLHQIHIPSLPNFQTGGGYFPFLKIYQSLQLIYTSCVYNPQTSRSRKLCVTMEPALLLKGDIMVKCYHRRSQAAEREVVFRIQFHTCTIHGAQLWFGKKDLDVACTDDRFPGDAAVEFIFSTRPEKINENQKIEPSIKVNYNASDPVVKWDSYENLNLHHQDSPENISHTRGPLDGSLYAQVRKRRGPGPTSPPNGCLASSPTVTTQIAKQSQILTGTASCVPSDRIENRSSFIAHPENEKTESLTAKGQTETKENVRGKEKDRETEILDDAKLSNPGGLVRGFCGRAGTTCGGVGRQWEQEPCLADGHCGGCCNSLRKHPKSQTLPALPSKSVSPPPHLTHMELCHRHSVHPLPELAWEQPPPSLPCLHRPCFPYSASEYPHSHGHTLPASSRHYNDECQVFHYASQAPSSHLSHQSLLPSPYREMFFGPPNQSPGCPCRECSSRREHQAASVRVLHSMHPDQAVGSQQTREAFWENKNPWEVPREADFWQCKSAVPPFHICHSAALNQGAEQQRIILGPQQSYPSPQPLMDIRDGASSGYHTPPPPRQSCPCSPYQSSPVESHGSRGYASGYLSGSASPLPASSPSLGGGRLPETPAGAKDQQQEHLKAEKAIPSAEVDISQGSEGRPDRSSAQTLDSDHDYTVIGGSSPTHTEDSLSQEASIALEINTNDIETPTTAETEQSQSSNIRPPSSERSHRRTSDGKKLEEVNVKENDQAAGHSHNATIIITPVDDQINRSNAPGDGPSGSGATQVAGPSPYSNSSQNSPTESPGHSSPSATDPPEHRLTPERAGGSTDTKPPSPVPDGYHTPTFPLAPYYYPLLNVPHVPYTGYTAITIPASQPPLPEKKRLSSTPGSLNGHVSHLRGSPVPSPTHNVTLPATMTEQRQGYAQFSSSREDVRVNAKFVQDSSKYWYKPGISRDHAIAVLKDKEPGTFLIRDSNSFQGAYGLAIKVATPPPNANITGTKADAVEQLVRHFLIETGPRGVKIKGCQNEAYFGSLSALVYQHSITPISLPCALRIPERDLVGDLQELRSVTNTSTAADLLKQGAACNVLYLNSVDTESLTGPEAVSKASKCTLALSPRPAATVVHFKVSSQGITLTDSKRRLFFRRHYPISSVTFSSLDPQDQRWTNSDSTSSKMFGFVARRTGSATENVCHLFAELDPEQPAVSIVNFINKVMLGPQLRR